MKYTITIDKELCIACSACYGTDPEHYESDAEGKSNVINGSSNGKSIGSFDDGRKDDAQRAADSCPVAAITIE